jgi:5-methylcytosine-specific restriction endonuclease McrA
MGGWKCPVHLDPSHHANPPGTAYHPARTPVSMPSHDTPEGIMAWENKRRTPADYIHPKKRDRVLRAHHGVCHLCGHPDADQVDHVTPWAEWTNPTLSVHDESNLAPAHGYPCPHCGRDCHADKTKAEAARGRARGNEQRKAQATRPREKHPGSLT